MPTGEWTGGSDWTEPQRPTGNGQAALTGQSPIETGQVALTAETIRCPLETDCGPDQRDPQIPAGDFD